MSAMLLVNNWDCPSGIPENQVGRWRVKAYRKPRGYYDMHHIGGYDIAKLAHPGRINCLQEKRGRKWEDWMTDDIVHVEAMRDYATRTKGPRVLVGGLGLGIYIQALMQRSDLTEVVVIERQHEVCSLTWEHIQRMLWDNNRDARFMLVRSDFFNLPEDIKHREFDTILTDFWVGAYIEPGVQELLARTVQTVNQYWPSSQQFYHSLDLFATMIRQREEVK